MKKCILPALIIQLFLCGNILYPSYGADAESDNTDTAIKQNMTEAHKLTSGDMLKVTVYKEPDLSGEFEVKDDGTITYPLLGSVDLKGLTTVEAEAKIAGLLKQGYVANPYVQLNVMPPAVPSTIINPSQNEAPSMQIGQSVTVLGCVGKPGLYPMPADKNLTVLQLIAFAGGFTRYASLSNTKIIRTNSDGKKETIYPHVNSAINGNGEDMVLEPGDMVYVPERTL